ncbi:MAG: SEC-C metal-binding domain-containing protein, partial [Candidatus Wolfebacteria bacterium]|nr:SEC-C metal-binding domain-containing protein [Candidatus Wolfebacteria bacterium]
KVEGYNFDSRKYLLEYDDVINKQRTAIYKKRQELLEKKVQPVVLSMLDILWMNYLEDVEALRESVGMRAYGQHEPLVEYRRESYLMYKEMMENFEKWTADFETSNEQGGVGNEKLAAGIKNIQNASSLMAQGSTQSGTPQGETPDGKKIGRNDLCYCGSGKKYKKCHGR